MIFGRTRLTTMHLRLKAMRSSPRRSRRSCSDQNCCTTMFQPTTQCTTSLPGSKTLSLLSIWMARSFLKTSDRRKQRQLPRSASWCSWHWISTPAMPRFRDTKEPCLKLTCKTLQVARLSGWRSVCVPRARTPRTSTS